MLSEESQQTMDLSDLIELTPRTQYLSAVELTAQRNAEPKQTLIGVGQKRTAVSGSDDEDRDLNQLYDNLRGQVSFARIDRIDGRALAVWDGEVGAMCVVRKDGKFDQFGHSCKGKYYLANYEALFLLELGRIQLEYNSMTMSVEQAYVLLLGEPESRKYYEYLVYTHLSRSSFILVKHNNRRYSEFLEVSPEACVWALLRSALAGVDVPDYVRAAPCYLQIKKYRDRVVDSIKEQYIMNRDQEEQEHEKDDNDNDDDDNDDNDEDEEDSVGADEFTLNFDTKVLLSGTKRTGANSCSAKVAPKKRRYEARAEQKSLLDTLKSAADYAKFESLFKQFDIVQTSADTWEVPPSCRDFEISFDLYLHNDGFRKSAPKPPTLRVIVHAPTEPLPTHDEMAVCYKRQLFPLPLLVVSVGESKQVQAFLFHFT